MDISNLSKPKILAALFNRAKPLGYGLIHYNPNHIMDEKEAEDLLSKRTFFDYLEGRLMKVELGGNELKTSSYNLDNGPNAAEDAIAEAFNLESA